MSVSARTHSPVVHIIEPRSGWSPVRLKEIWEYRDLLYFLVWREVRVRYKQTALGAAWAVIQPLATMVVFSLLFGRLAGLPSDGLPYPVYTFCALLPWQLFAFSLSESSQSVVSNKGMVSRVYFPRLILPIASVCVGLVDFSVSLVVLLLLMAWYGIVPGVAIVTAPLWVAVALATALAAGFWLSALNVRYRDIRYTLPFLTQLWMFATPVAYASSLVPERWRPLYALNPMVGVIDGFRWSLLGTQTAPWGTVAVSAVVLAVVIIGGLYYFRRTERTFADVL